MSTKTKKRLLTTYNKLIPLFWLVLHSLIVSVCVFVVLINRSLKPVSSIPAWNDEPAGNESAARIEGEVFSISYLENFKAYYN